MKKILFMLPLLAVALVSCNKDNGNSDDEIIQFNDPNFLKTLLNYTYDYGYGKRVIIDTNGDGQISYAEAQSFSGEMGLSAEFAEDGNYAYQINNIDEIKYFTSLTCLSCPSHKVEYADLSANTRLGTVEFGGNGLKELNISKCTALTFLYCDRNRLTTLDLSNNTALIYLYCRSNQLTTLDLSNTALIGLDCRDNPLETLIISASQQNASWMDSVKKEYPNIKIEIK